MNRWAERRVAVFFFVSGAAAIGLIVAYWNNANAQWLGVLLALAFGGLALGLVTWANRLMPPGPYAQEREPHGAGGGDDATVAAEREFERGVEDVGRRRLLTRALGFAAVATGLAAVTPLRSLGPRPGKKLARTPWRANTRAVTEDGQPVRASDVPVGGTVVIFPEGYPGSADGQAVLVRLEPHLLKPRADRRDWSPDGLIAFSRVCTHAGCPVGLYEANIHQLLCPCHQSAFDVLREAKPVFGPAAAPLPQLPLRIDGDGFVRAQSDFPEPIGPDYWRRG